MPDKAIDLIDEACAMVRVEMDSMPQELYEISHKVGLLEIEKASFAKEDKDEKAKERLSDIENELAELKNKEADLKAKWEKEKKQLEEVKNAKNNLEKLKRLDKQKKLLLEKV